MRPGNQNNKRMRGRGRKAPNPLTRSYESNGPDVKIRGTATHIAEKYQQLARDAHASGDRVVSENYYQHAEHYLRIVAAAQPQTNQQSSSSHRSDADEDAGANQTESTKPVAAENAQPSETSEEQPQPVIGLDTPQPFIEEEPAKKAPRRSAKAAEQSEEDVDADGASDHEEDEDDDKPRRRTRGTRGRGLRRAASAPVAALPEEGGADGEVAEVAAAEGDGETAAPRAKRTPRVRTPRVPRSPRTPRTRRTKAADESAEAPEGAEG
ncbi:DUF4167 domain-containing protein [Pseudovibrio sp. SPO723]|nr:DUF4167 domain-containing protein [Pseudovibrio sp. SPO723]MDX5594852.1 DUF4167 domain-containing protein [Pseudovibrio sp. SPO723]